MNLADIDLGPWSSRSLGERLRRDARAVPWVAGGERSAPAAAGVADVVLEWLRDSAHGFVTDAVCAVVPPGAYRRELRLDDPVFHAAMDGLSADVAALAARLAAAQGDLEPLAFEDWRDPRGARVLSVHAGARDPHLAVIAHLDTVPPGDLASWTVPPHEGTVRKGPHGETRVYGRGACDDRGSFVCGLATLLAFREVAAASGDRALAATGFAVLGDCQEETFTDEGLPAYYAERPPKPAGAIVADGEFPPTEWEAGVLRAHVVAPAPPPVGTRPGGRVAFEGTGPGLVVGNAANMIPGRARVLATGVDAAVLRAIASDEATVARLPDGRLLLEATGRQSHAAAPAPGGIWQRNALQVLARVVARGRLAGVLGPSPECDLLAAVAFLFGADAAGSIGFSIGGPIEDGRFRGPDATSFAPTTVARAEDGALRLTIDIRHAYGAALVEERLQAAVDRLRVLGLEVRIAFDRIMPPYEAPRSRPREVMESVCSRLLPRLPARGASHGRTDQALLAGGLLVAAGPAVLAPGESIFVARNYHAADEMVVVDDLLLAAAAYLEWALRMASPPAASG